MFYACIIGEVSFFVQLLMVTIKRNSNGKNTSLIV